MVLVFVFFEKGNGGDGISTAELFFSLTHIETHLLSGSARFFLLPQIFFFFSDNISSLLSGLMQKKRREDGRKWSGPPFLEPQSRFGEKLLGFLESTCPQNESRVLKAHFGVSGMLLHRGPHCTR